MCPPCQASANENDVAKLQASLDSYQTLVNEQKAMLDRLQRENTDMMSRITLTEHANGVALHDSYLETEKVKYITTCPRLPSPPPLATL